MIYSDIYNVYDIFCHGEISCIELDVCRIYTYIINISWHNITSSGNQTWRAGKYTMKIDDVPIKTPMNRVDVQLTRLITRVCVCIYVYHICTDHLYQHVKLCESL